MATDELAQWYDEGKRGGYRWLEVGWDLWDREYCRRLCNGDAQPERTNQKSFQGCGFIDLTKPLEGQRIYLDEEPY